MLHVAVMRQALYKICTTYITECIQLIAHQYSFKPLCDPTEYKVTSCSVISQQVITSGTGNQM